MDGDPVRVALERLVGSGVLAPEQVEPVARAVREAQAEAARAGARGGAGVRWTEVVAYVGGGLVLAGASALVAAAWTELSQGARMAVLWTVTAGLLGGAALLGRDVSVPVRRRIAATLAALGAGMTAFAVTVSLTMTGDALIGSALGLAVAAGTYARLATPLGLLTCAALAVVATGFLLEVSPAPDDGLVWGGAYLVLGAVFTALAAAGLLRERALGLGAGAAIMLGGGQLPLAWGGANVWAYLGTAAVALACFALYRRERTWVLILAGVAGLTLAVPEAIWDWTDGAVGGALVLVLAGVVLLATGALGLRLHRRPG